MPATEQTWRNQRVMHIIFGVSALVMMISTLWMLAKDHNREWKRWQLADRKKEARMVQARRDQLADQFGARMETYNDEIRELQSKPMDQSLLDRFQRTVVEEDARLSLPKSNVSALDAAFAAFQIAAQEVQAVAGAGESEAEQATNLTVAQEQAIKARSKLIAEFSKFIDKALRREKQLVERRKFVAADRTASVSALGLQIGGGASEADVTATQEKIQGYTDRIAELTEQIAAAKTYRTGLESILNDFDAELTKINKERDALETDLARLDKQVYKDTSNLGEWITRWPVLNALYDGNIRIDQIWLPDLTINYNFSQVARFDRCKSCHRAISQPAPGTATDPAYPTLSEAARDLTLQLQTPDGEPEEGATLRDVYGLVLSDQPLVGYKEQTLVHYVLPESLAAQAGLESGDVIVKAGDVPVFDPPAVENFLLKQMKWGEPTTLEIRRGLDHPYTTHPRLDLYLSDSSPHPEKVMGCTICHDGQGSGTEFPWTSHTPDNAKQQIAWNRDHGWFDNHHWIFPMKPARFAESNCTKCHYDKAGLEPSERFPEPPAAKLVEGWTLVEKFGCFGCHEINGYDGPDKRIGPDLRLEPNYSDVAQQILTDPGLSDEEREWAQKLVEVPGDVSARHLLLAAITKDARLTSTSDAAAEAKLTAATHKLADGLKDVEVPGTYRRVGPSLRYLSSKVDFPWLYSWIRRPSDFRPSTRMPQFFGQFEHLQDPGDAEELAESKRFEAVEIRALAEFLLANSQEFKYQKPSAEVTEQPSAERGKWLFESRGCLACHSHESFPGIAANQGPDLSRISAKFNSETGALWLYSWLKEPHHYHVRTKMPNLYLDPIVEKDALGKPTGKVTDPAADIAVFLLGQPVDWEPTDVPGAEWSEKDQAALADLAVEWLASDTIPRARAREFVAQGIPDHLEPKLKADEALLLKKNFSNRQPMLKEFVARRTISKYGCFGCHDIPGFELEKPIGTTLADWGRKESSRLAFENIHKFLEGPGHPRGDHAEHDEGGHGHLDPGDFDDDMSYFIQALNSHARDGFIWQKLRMPRSYDYKTTKNKGFNERLRMPMFPLTVAQREAVITFVLGLVSEPPAEKFVYHPSTERQAIIEGRAVLERFNCAGCHTLEMEQWRIAFEEGLFGSPSEVVDFPFLDKHFSRNEIAESLVTDQRGKYHATLHGQPVMSEEDGGPQRFDEDGLPLEPDDNESEPYYRFTLWRDALVQGETWPVGLQDLMVPASRAGFGPDDGQAYPAFGGDLARYLYSKVIAKARETNPQAKGSEAWGWLPPPLMTEGEKVQPDWLHDFLMDPTAIRPAVVMRMPNFKMASDEAAKLVNYFAAASQAEFPYEYKPQQRASYIAREEAEHPQWMTEAMNIVVDGNYCVKCHAVADFQPEGDVTTFGPNLADVYRRLRPTYVRNWVANPKRTLPYTGMPVNIIYKPDAEHLGGVSQTLFPGTSLQQLQGLVDLLMNFDVYARSQTSITPLVKSVPAGDSQATNVDEPTNPLR